MKTFVLMFQEITGQWVSVYHVAVVDCLPHGDVIQYVKKCLLAGKLDGRYVGNRCVVYCLEDHSMVELVCKDDFVEVYS